MASAEVDVAGDLNLVHLQIEPPVDAHYLLTTYLLDLVEAAGTAVVNRPAGIRELHEKLWVQRFPDLCPVTHVGAFAPAPKVMSYEFALSATVVPLPSVGFQSAIRFAISRARCWP